MVVITTLLLYRRSINISSGGQAREGHFCKKKPFESLEMRYHMTTYLLDHLKIPLITVGWYTPR